jgi:quercetin dioxygenase-like cupin family protein
MVRIYRAESSEKAIRAGYEAIYVADITFRKLLDSCGVILVDIERNGKSSPHSHEHLEELFIALTEIHIFINDTRYELNEGDVVIVEPGEAHSFGTKGNQLGRVIALKFPNIKDDKVIPSKGNEN